MAVAVHKYAHCLPPIPVRHKRKVPFQPSLQPPAKFQERIYEVMRLDAELDRVVLRPSDHFDLLSDAYSSNFHFSTKIEGNPLPLEEVRRMTRNSFEGVPQKARDNHMQEILNHILTAVDPEMMHTPWTTASVTGLHRLLLTGVDPESKPGEFRTFDGAVQDLEGTERFITCPGKHVQEETQALLDWMNGPGSLLYTIPSAAIFFHEFESIHPFADGNGRTGRALFHSYLTAHGLPNANLCMIEAELTADPDLYYRILGWADFTGQYTDLVDFFLDATLASYRAAVKRFTQRDLRTGSLDETKKRLLVQAKKHKEYFSIADAAKWVQGRSEATVRRHLNALVDDKILVAVGATKSKRYRYPNALKDALDAAAAAANAPPNTPEPAAVVGPT